MTPIELLWNIILNTFQVGVDVNNDPIYIDKSRSQIENQDNFIMPTKGIFILLTQSVPSRQIAINTQIKNLVGGGISETVTALYQSIIGIELLSKDFSAVRQKDNLMIYLNSYISRNLQNQNGMYIAAMSASPFSLSQIEGADRINRFRFDIAINHTNAITYNIPYYDSNFIPQVTFEEINN